MCDDCKEYTRPSKDQKSCVTDQCTENEIILKSGKCMSCDENWTPSDDKMVCELKAVVEIQVTE